MSALDQTTVETRGALRTLMVHIEHPVSEGEAWCGASVLGVYTTGDVECIVCAELNDTQNWWELHGDA